MRTKTAPIEVPPLRKHKATGQAYVLVDKPNKDGKIEKRRVYLGKFDSSEAKEKYRLLVADWAKEKTVDAPTTDLTITELVEKHMVHVHEYYKHADGTPTSEVHVIKNALRDLVNLHGLMFAIDFSCTHLLALREAWIARGLCRKTINHYMDIVRRMFKWSVSIVIMRVELYQSLMTIERLRAGRSRAKESIPIKPVLESHVNAIESFLPRVVWLAIQLQMRCGARSGELLRLKPVDVDTTGPVWTAEIRQHKTAHLGRPRVLVFGPKCQAILRELMADCNVAGYLFDPHRAIAERAAAAPGHRREGQPDNPRKTDRVVGEHYDPASYRRCVAAACQQAKIPVWHPHQLRHFAGKLARREGGLDASQALLGHASAQISELYSELDLTKAASVAMAIG